jgi:hypothetical protein
LSSSDREHYTLTAEAPLEAVVQVLDENDNVVGGRGSHSLPLGIYTVRAEISGRIAEEMVRLTRDRTITVYPPRFLSAPIANASNSHEYYSYPAERLSTVLTRAVSIGEGPFSARLFIFIRTPYMQLYRGEPLAENLVLLDGDGSVVSTFRHDEVVVDGAGYLAYSVSITPGSYRLVTAGAEGRELGLEIPANWQLQVFLIYRDRVLLESATCFLARKDVGFRREDEVASDVDFALSALNNRAAELPDETRDRLLSGKFENPMLGLLAAHLLLQAPEPDSGLLGVVLANLYRLLGAEPDVVALELMMADRFQRPLPALQLARPPMLRAGFEGVTRIAARAPEVIAADSLCERISTQLYTDSPWVTWQPLPDLATARGTADESIMLDTFEATEPGDDEATDGGGYGSATALESYESATVEEGYGSGDAPSPKSESAPMVDPGVQWSWVHAALLDSLQTRAASTDPAVLAERLRVSQSVVRRALDELRVIAKDPSALESVYGEVPTSLPDF